MTYISLISIWLHFHVDMEHQVESENKQIALF